MTYDIIYIISCIFGVFYIKNFMTGFYGASPKPSLIQFAVYMCYPLIVCTAYFLINIPVSNMIANLLMIFFVSILYNGKILKKIICTMFLYLFMLITEAAIALLSGYIGHSPFETGDYSGPLGPIIVDLLLYLSSLIFVKISKLLNNETVKAEEWLAIFFIPVSSIFITIVIAVSEQLDAFQGVISIILILIINILVFNLYERLLKNYNDKIEKIVFEQEKQYYYNQCSIIEKNAEDTRIFRHDMKNHMMTILEMLKDNKTKEAENMISKLFSEKLTEKGTYSDTGNIAIDSVLNYKLKEAEDNNIKVTSDIDVPNNLLLDPTDITAIAGNLLDNAINALKKLNENERTLTVRIYYDKGRLFMLISNSYNGILNESGGMLKTTNSNKENHGYGLKSVYNILKKYNGGIEYKYNSDFFTAVTMMYIKCEDICV